MRVSRLGLVSGLLVFLTILAGFGLASSRVIAEGENAGGGVSCTISYGGDGSYSVSLLNGNYQANIGNATVKSICNDTSGYAIYAVGNSENEFGNNDMVARINDATNPEYNIHTGPATSGENSAWAMKASAIAGAYAPTIDNEFGNYRVVPSQYTRVAYTENTTDDTVGSLFNLSYAIYVSTTQPAGTYTGKVKYTMVHPYTEQPCEYRKICYKKNGDDVVGGMGEQTTSGSTATLWASNFSREGYGFAGWNTKADGTGTSYGPNETITLPSDMSDGMYLFAMWVASAGNLQGWEGCYNMSVGQVTALTDTRDNDTYAVAKLADGNCWLIENLRLGNVDNDSSAVVLSSSNTNNPSLPITNSIDQSTGEILASSNSLSASQNPATNTWCTDNNSACDGQSKIFTGNVTDRVTNMVTASTSVYAYGTYYNWYSATAGNGKYGDNGVASGDICPSSWFLPYGGSGTGNKGGNTSGGYYYLSAAMNATEDSATSSAIMRSFPINYVYGGQVNGASTVSRGVGGSYWSSTGGTNGASSLNVSASSFNPGTGYNNKGFGRLVRCVTESVPSHNVTVNFDDGVSEVTLSSNKYGTKTVGTSGATIALMDGTEYTVSAIYEDGRGFDGWETTANGTLGSSTSAETTYVVTGDATLTLNSKDVCLANKICYFANGDTAHPVVGTMGKQNADANTDIMLLASNYSRNGYGFAGWNTEPDYSGTFYGPHEDITTPADMSGGLSLYAIWIASAGSMQTDAINVCSSLTSAPTDGTASLASVSALTDQRDGDTYAIAKLADGKCWMVENLRLESTASHNSDGSLAQGYGTSATYGDFSGLADPESPWIGDSTTANSLYSIDGSNDTISINTNNDPSRRFPRYNNQNTASRDINTTTSQSIYSYGNYYTWAAAIADLSPHNTNNQTVAETSLCPAGWHLPTGGAAYASDSTTGVNVTGDASTYRDFYNLSYRIMDKVKTAYEDTPNNGESRYTSNTTNTAGDTATKAFRKFPNNFLLSGYVYNGSVDNRNSYGLYWSSTAHSSDYGYRLYLNASTVYPSTAGGNKFYGRSVRCVSDYTSIEGYDYMQDFATLSSDEKAEVLDSMTEGTQYQLTDSRDDKVYYVSKLADGNIWMTQNLDLDLDSNTTYTNEDTDIGFNSTTGEYETASWAPSSSTKSKNNMSWTSNKANPDSYDPGDICWNGNFDFEGDENFSAMTEGCSRENHYHFGNYYNFPAAIAVNNADLFTTANYDVDQSICPAGWMMPKSSYYIDDNTFASLIIENDYTDGPDGNIQSAPLYFTYTGGWSGGSLEDINVGGSGGYWSSVVDNINTGYTVAFGNESLYTSYSIMRNAGINVRCMAR